MRERPATMAAGLPNDQSAFKPKPIYRVRSAPSDPLPFVGTGMGAGLAAIAPRVENPRRIAARNIEAIRYAHFQDEGRVPSVA